MSTITTAAEALTEVERAREAGGRPNLREANLYGADLRWADLYGADLRGADLRGADLRWADLREANLYGADLRGADLRWADLREANLYGADLRWADLYGADLREANLYGADLREADLRWADLYGADLREANLCWAGGGVLQISSLPSGQVIAKPTPDGWHVVVGCWSGTPNELLALCDAPDEEWPEARDNERKKREPILRAAHALIVAHTEYNAGLVEELAEKWKKAQK